MTTQNRIVGLEREIEPLKGANKHAHITYKEIFKGSGKLEEERDEYKRSYEALRDEAVGATDTDNNR
jgi:hypothetical protein